MDSLLGRVMINTRRVKDRRKLRFENLEAALQDASKLVEAEQAGTLRRTGNWTLGQALGHLAFWADAPFDGYPDMPVPWLVRVMAKLFKKRVIFNVMDPGMRIGRVPNGTFGLDVIPAPEGLSRLRRAYNRLAAQTPSKPNPAFGPLTHEEWLGLNLRHAELHLSFFHPA
jgi:hypothetical protein